MSKLSDHLKARDRNGRHFDDNERFYIETERRKGTSVREIAKSIGRPRQSVYREIQKGTVEQLDTELRIHRVYYADVAERITKERQSKKGAELKIGTNHELAQAIEKIIRTEDYSPYAALQKLKRQGWKELFTTKTLYNYIHAGVLGISMEDLPMRGKQRKRNQETYRHAHRNLNAKSIELRPKSAKNRIEFGHWEGDLIIGAQGTRTVLFTLVERKTRFCMTATMKSKEKKNVVEFFDRLEKIFGKDFPHVFKSVTFDNGSEFADWEAMEKSFYRRAKGSRTEIYYAHPYCSSERGTNEVTNRFIRRRIPKSTNIGNYKRKAVQKITEWINNYPRLILKGLNAREAFEWEVGRISEKLLVRLRKQAI